MVKVIKNGKTSVRRGKEAAIVGAISDYIGSNMTVAAIANKYNTSSVTVYRWVDKYYSRDLDAIVFGDR